MSWDNFHDQIASFAGALRRFSETEETARSLDAQYSKFRNQWIERRSISTDKEAILVPIPRNQATHPISTSITEAGLNIEFVLGDDIEKKCMPSKCDFQVYVKADYSRNKFTLELEDHWRVDTDGYAAPGNQRSKEPHPLFHFQRGGHAQDGFALDPAFAPGLTLVAQDGLWRGLFQSPGPRLPFFPMCPILVIDFVIGQHNGVVWGKLRGDSDYLAIVKKSQLRLWKPFSARLPSQEFLREWFGPLVLDSWKE